MLAPLGGPNAREIAVEEAWTIPRLNLPSQRVTQPMIDSWPHLKGLDIPLVDSKNVTVLLGANVLDAILHTEVRRGSSGPTSSCQHGPWLDPDRSRERVRSI